MKKHPVFSMHINNGRVCPKTYLSTILGKQLRWVGSTYMVLVEMRERFVRSGIAEPGSTRDITAFNLAPKGDERNTKQMI